MRLQQDFVVPLPVEEARRLVAQLERFAPAVPGVQVRLTVEAHDERSTTVRVTSELPAGAGVASTVAIDLATRLLRQYGRRLVDQAAARAAARGTGDGGGRARTTEAAVMQSPADSSDPTQSPATPSAVIPPAGRRGDVWAAVTDSVIEPSGRDRPIPVPVPVRRRRSSLQINPRDVVAVVGAAAAFAVLQRAIRARRRP